MTVISIENLVKILSEDIFSDITNEKLGQLLYHIFSKLEQADKRPEAEWEYVQYGSPKIGNWHCTRCRTIVPHMPKTLYKWCPGCGAKMKGAEK